MAEALRSSLLWTQANKAFEQAILEGDFISTLLHQESVAETVVTGNGQADGFHQNGGDNFAKTQLTG